MRLKASLLIAIGALAIAACAKPSLQAPTPANKAGSAAQNGIPNGQLPTTVEPLGYMLDFTMDPRQSAFSAHSAIRIRIKQPLDTIWLHGRDIRVNSAQIKLANGKTLDAGYEQVNKAGVVRLSLPQTVQPQKATLIFDFTNPYSPGLMGAYKVSVDGKDYIFTQFEAIAARRAFPSFDEPRFKTPFTLSFTVPEGDKVVTNTPLRSKTTLDNGRVKWQFVTTHPQPTYLIAWAVGPLDIVKGPPIPPNQVRDHPIPLYGVTVAGKGDMIHYALQHAGAIIAAEEAYYDIPYPWYKLSLIAVPDFAAGAMENSGAVTFRDSLLLMDPETASTRQIRSYWGVAAHEFGHMWSGDLVTVPWWNDIWLNESFATWMANKTIGTLHPDWHSKIRAAQSSQYVMYADSLLSARAIRQPIHDNGDIKTAFDGITYAKGAAVIRMFEHYVGADKFRQGMHNYFERYSYDSGTLEGLLSALSKAADMNIGPAFKTFLNQPGLPMVSVAVKDKDGQPMVHLEQSRYFPIGSSGERHGQLWIIPVCMRYGVAGTTHQQCVMFDKTSTDVALKTDDMPTWLMPNDQGIGYYQWSLNETGYDALAHAFSQLAVPEQISMAGSISAAFHGGRLNTAQTMEALAPLAHSENHAVAQVPTRLISFAREHLVHGDAKAGVEAYARKLYAQYDLSDDFQPHGAPEDANQRRFETALAGFLIRTGQDKMLKEAASAAAERVLGLNTNKVEPGTFNSSALSSDFIPLALETAVRAQGRPVFDALLSTFKQAQSPFVRGTSLDALASTTDPELAERVRTLILNTKLVKQNEVRAVLYGQLSQPQTRDATWQWIKMHYDALSKRMPGNFGGNLPSVAGMFCSDAKAAEVKQFFQGKLEAHPGAERNLTQALESAHLCAALKQAQSASAQAFFAPLAKD